MRICVLLGSALLWAAPACGESLPSGASIETVIDRYIDLRLREAQIHPAALANEATLIRRTMLDLAGRIPAAAEVKAYLDSTEPDKRGALVDRLMNSVEFIDYMATRFDWFITQGDGQIGEYLKTAFREQFGWDRIFRDILLADLRPEPAHGATEFLKERVEDTDRLTNDVSVAFFGVNISCAKCHDHFLAPDWTQDHFYGMKTFFSRTFDNGGFVAERDYGLVSFKTTDGEERDARPMYLTDEVIEVNSTEPSDEERKEYEEALETCKKNQQAPPAPQLSLRERLVEVALADEEDLFFAKAIVNRLWHHFFGTGFVMPLDQMHSENPPSHPELLEWLARDLAEQGYDLRRLIRGIVMSAAYARSSDWQGADRPYPESFAVSQARPLTPTQLARSLSLATADPSAWEGAAGEELYRRIAEAAAARHVEQFDQPSDDFRISASESLWFTNSEQFEQEYLQGGLVKRLQQMDDPHARIEAAVWSALSRGPTAEEVDVLQQYLNERADRPDRACRQLVWALLASSEFRFNY
jgi:hypothetical protein